jgi:hypothetical protein
MSIRTSLTIIKIASVVFGSAAIVFAVKYFDGVNQNYKLKETITLDKKNYSNELSEIFNRYDSAVLKNKKLLQLTQNTTITSIKNKDITLKEIYTADNFSDHYQPKLIQKIDSLKALLNKENQERDALKNQVENLIVRNRELLKQSTNNETLAATARNLTATNVYANGIKIVSNNIIETRRFSKTQQIKVCFTLLENNATIKGNKDIYIQIINPKKVILSKEEAFAEIGNNILQYSAKTNVYYDNDELDVCVFVDSNKKDIEKGDYEINILSGTKLIGSTVFALK